MFSLFDTFLSDPLGMILIFAAALPGRLLAITAHEYAHGYAAYLCGDPTAKRMGRLTLNPLRHLDLIGTLMMLLVGFGWAKPVPVDPRYYRNPRRDDLIVSLAGVTMNALLFLLGSAALYAWLGISLAGLEKTSYAALRDGARALVDYRGTLCCFDGTYLYDVGDLMRNAPYLYQIIGDWQGGVAGTLYRMLGYFIQTNLALMIFNLIPIPPLDGYHVLNDLILKKSLFAGRDVMRVCTGVMMMLMFTGVLSEGMGIAMNWVITGIGNGAAALFAAFIPA